MIRFAPILVIIALVYDESIVVRSVPQLDTDLLQRLKQIEGYHLLHEMHPLLYGRDPENAIIEHIMGDIDPSKWHYSLNGFKQAYFENPCKAAYELYNSNKNYFDQLPPVDTDPDTNLLCRLGLVVRDCNMYLSGAFVNDVYIDLLRKVIHSFKQA